MSEQEKEEADQYAAAILHYTAASVAAEDAVNGSNNSIRSDLTPELPRFIYTNNVRQSTVETIGRLLRDCESISNPSEQLPQAIAELVSVCQQQDSHLATATETIIQRLEELTRSLQEQQQQQQPQQRHNQHVQQPQPLSQEQQYPTVSVSATDNAESPGNPGSGTGRSNALDTLPSWPQSFPPFLPTYATNTNAGPFITAGTHGIQRFEEKGPTRSLGQQTQQDHQQQQYLTVVSPVTSPFHQTPTRPLHPTTTSTENTGGVDRFHTSRGHHLLLSGGSSRRGMVVAAEQQESNYCFRRQCSDPPSDCHPDVVVNHGGNPNFRSRRRTSQQDPPVEPPHRREETTMMAAKDKEENRRLLLQEEEETQEQDRHDQTTTEKEGEEEEITFPQQEQEEDAKEKDDQTTTEKEAKTANDTGDHQESSPQVEEGENEDTDDNQVSQENRPPVGTSSTEEDHTIQAITAQIMKKMNKGAALEKQDEQAAGTIKRAPAKEEGEEDPIVQAIVAEVMKQIGPGKVASTAPNQAEAAKQAAMRVMAKNAKKELANATNTTAAASTISTSRAVSNPPTDFLLERLKPPAHLSVASVPSDINLMDSSLWSESSISEDPPASGDDNTTKDGKKKGTPAKSGPLDPPEDLDKKPKARQQRVPDFCLQCGIKTHTQCGLQLPLTNENVHNGVCIKCNPAAVPAKVLQNWVLNLNGNPRMTVPTSAGETMESLVPARASMLRRKSEGESNNTNSDTISNNSALPHGAFRVTNIIENAIRNTSTGGNNDAAGGHHHQETATTTATTPTPTNTTSESTSRDPAIRPIALAVTTNLPPSDPQSTTTPDSEGGEQPSSTRTSLTEDTATTAQAHSAAAGPWQSASSILEGGVGGYHSNKREEPQPQEPRYLVTIGRSPVPLQPRPTIRRGLARRNLLMNSISESATEDSDVQPLPGSEPRTSGPDGPTKATKGALAQDGPVDNDAKTAATRDERPPEEAAIESTSITPPEPQVPQPTLSSMIQDNDTSQAALWLMAASEGRRTDPPQPIPPPAPDTAFYRDAPSSSPPAEDDIEVVVPPQADHFETIRESAAAPDSTAAAAPTTTLVPGQESGVEARVVNAGDDRDASIFQLTQAVLSLQQQMVEREQNIPKAEVIDTKCQCVIM